MLQTLPVKAKLPCVARLSPSKGDMLARERQCGTEKTPL